MKNHHSIIKMIIMVAVVIGLGVVAFKYLHNAKSKNNVVIQTASQSLQITPQSPQTYYIIPTRQIPILEPLKNEIKSKL